MMLEMMLETVLKTVSETVSETVVMVMEMLMEMHSTQGMHGMQSYDRAVELLMIKDLQVPTLATCKN